MDSSEGESFDFDGITTSSDGASVKRTPGRPRIVRTAGTTPKPRKARASVDDAPRAKPGPKPKPKSVKAKGKARRVYTGRNDGDQQRGRGVRL